MTEVISVYAPGHLDPMDSYGYIACELVRHLTRIGVKANGISLGDPRHPHQDAELKSYTEKPIVPAKGGILLGYPTGFHKYGELANEHPKIALTMFESSKIPADWVSILNDCDAVIVPSGFCESIFADCGVRSRIYVIPLGIGDAYKPVQRENRSPFTFLTLFDRGKRKGGLTAQQAFTDEFGDDPNVKLIMKHRAEKVRKKLVLTNDNIDVIYEDMTAEELNELYQSCHCLVNPNKGEGFGLIPREFAATGGISLATGWGGTADLINFWGHRIDFDLEVADWAGAQNLEGQDLGLWAAPKKDQLQSLMRKMYENRDCYLRQAYENAKVLPELYSWKYLAYRIWKIWRCLNDR